MSASKELSKRYNDMGRDVGSHAERSSVSQINRRGDNVYPKQQVEVDEHHERRPEWTGWERHGVGLTKGPFKES